MRIPLRGHSVMAMCSDARTPSKPPICAPKQLLQDLLATFCAPTQDGNGNEAAGLRTQLDMPLAVSCLPHHA